MAEGGTKRKVQVRSYIRTRDGRPAAVRGHVRTARKEEFAPGIPRSRTMESPPIIKHPQHWLFVVQKHSADRRGEHLDLRLATRGKAYSWVPSGWPTPGQSVWAVEQPTHTQSYATWEGTIAKGEYGAGEVKVDREGPAIVYSSGPDKVNFTVIDGRKTEDLALIRIHGRMWKLVNYTPQEGAVTPHQFKPSYREKDIQGLDPNDDSTVWTAKIDGAHGVAVLETGKRPRVFSYRVPVKGGFIEWTHKIPGAFDQKVPAGLGSAVVRVEVWAQKNNRPVPVETIAGMLNSNVLTSRELQREIGRLRPTLIDVVAVKNQDASGWSGDEKLALLRKIHAAMPLFSLPDTAETPEDKIRLAQKIIDGSHPQTEEGIVLVPRGVDKYTKAKVRPETDVYVREVYAGKEGTRLEGTGAGGFRYSWTPDGPIIGNVGTGFSDKLRREMWEHPERFVGLVAKVKGQKYKSGTGRTLSFIDWHQEKGAFGGYTQHELRPAVTR